MKTFKEFLSESTSGPLYPNVKVPLVGFDGNAYAILGRARNAAKKGGVPKEKIEEFHKEATSGDYNNLLSTVMKWFDTDEEETEEDEFEEEEDVDETGFTCRKCGKNIDPESDKDDLCDECFGK